MLKYTALFALLAVQPAEAVLHEFAVDFHPPDTDPGWDVMQVFHLGTCIDTTSDTCRFTGQSFTVPMTLANGDPWQDSAGNDYAWCEREHMGQDANGNDYGWIYAKARWPTGTDYPSTWPSYVRCDIGIGGGGGGQNLTIKINIDPTL